jgi:hypothetical protein
VAFVLSSSRLPVPPPEPPISYSSSSSFSSSREYDGSRRCAQNVCLVLRPGFDFVVSILCPEGTIGLSLGFYPQECVDTETRPEGALVILRKYCILKQLRILNKYSYLIPTLFSRLVVSVGVMKCR